MTLRDDYTTHACELCGGRDFAEIPEARLYTRDQPIHVCRGCGFVQVVARRSPERIAEVWSKELFKTAYTARIPLVRARQVYVADTIDTEIGLKGRSLCDIGAGEGAFLGIVRDWYRHADVFGIEPSADNCRSLTASSIEHFHGTIEAYAATAIKRRRFDIVTIMWTLENCNSCNIMLDAAWHLLNDGGHICIATGSRLLVPFKKPLQLYLSKTPADTHSFRFTPNILCGLLAKAGFETVFVNRYVDSDWLIVIGKKTDRSKPIAWSGDDPKEVLDFFRRWHLENAHHAKA